MAKKNIFKIIGIMSGTSHDGVDAALVEIRSHFVPNDQGLNLRLINHIHVPYRKTLRVDIAKAFNGNTEHICRLNYVLGEIFAKAVLSLLKTAGLTSSDIDAVASHGQTIYHIPPSKGKNTSTLQIGEAAIIAERTKILTVSDFRARDIAAGGNGAPLVSLPDYLLFGRAGKRRAILNIGGIANVTVVSEKREDTIAFDCGPGNSLIDEAVKLSTTDKYSYDRNGSIARQGKVNEKLLSRLLSHPYFRIGPPKSTGREAFGTDYAKHMIKVYEKIEQRDFICTLTHLTAVSICRAITPFKPDEIIVTGGGAKNSFLMTLLKDLFQGIAFRSITDHGIPIEAKEAVSFAILGYETLTGRPGNIPSATGAKHSVVLGK